MGNNYIRKYLPYKVECKDNTIFLYNRDSELLFRGLLASRLDVLGFMESIAIDPDPVFTDGCCYLYKDLSSNPSSSKNLDAYIVRLVDLLEYLDNHLITRNTKEELPWVETFIDTAAHINKLESENKRLLSRLDELREENKSLVRHL